MIVLSCIVALLTGVGVFIVGMNMMSHALESTCGVGVKRILGKISNNRFAGVGIGASVTAIIQSSSATTVMVIGLVNAGVITLFQATSIIMGANIGTTITGIIASFSSINISKYISLLAFIGVMLMFIKKNAVKNIGEILTGLGLIFVGLSLMGKSFNNEEITSFFIKVFSSINFPILLILIGVIFTALIQSSSAMSGIVIVMAGSGALSLESGLFIILGTNIGTCVTALISSIGTSSNAKRASLIHLIFNVIGTLLFTIILLIFNQPIINLLNSLNIAIEFKISLFHVVFNVTTCLLLLPFINALVSLANILVKEPKDKHASSLKFIDSHLLITPSVAQMQAKNEILNMFGIAKANFMDSISLLIEGKGDEDEIDKRESELDYINNAIAKFLVALSSGASSKQEEVIGAYFHVINDIERIGDHAYNILKLYKEMHGENLVFSPSAIEEIKALYSNVLNSFQVSYDIFRNNDKTNLCYLDKLEEKTDSMKKEMSAKHFARLIGNNCKLELTSYYTTLISNIERVGDHLVNIGYSVLNPTGTQISEEMI